MTDRPIIFGAPMVRALLAGRKTMTRRVLKPQPLEPKFGDGYWFDLAREPHAAHDAGERPITPYMRGDRLWVRETMTKFTSHGSWLGGDLVRSTCHYPADDTGVCAPPGIERVPDGRAVWQWKRSSLPSIHMPRWASRLTLIIESVKVERLQEISEEDAKAEGARWFADLRVGNGVLNARWSMEDPRDTGECLDTARFAFGNYWVKLHGWKSPDTDWWAANPWVAAISFRVVKANIDAPESKAA